MKRFLLTAGLSIMAGTLALGSTAIARPHHGYGPPPHHGWHDRSDWRKGGYVARNDWDRGVRVDYRRSHLRAPPRGYEWRRVNNNYVLAAVATGLIASIIANSH